MPRIHPKPDVIDSMLELVPELRLKVLRHLCDCPTCYTLWIGAPIEEKQGAAPAEGGRVLPWRPPMAEYGTAIDRVLSDIQVRFQEAEWERAAAPGLLEELRRHPPERASWLIAGSARFHSLALLHLLVRTADEEVHRDPQQAERWAGLALHLADHLDPDRFGARVIEDARARCWVSIGNARRVASDLQRAGQAFRAAEAHLRLGTRDPLERAHLLTLKASLLRAQRRFEEAVAVLRRALSVWLSVGEPRRVVTSLMVWVRICQETGRDEEALPLLRIASSMTGPDFEPRLKVVIRHNLLICLMDLGRLREARALLARSRALYRQVSEPLIQLRRRWVEAQLVAASGRISRAVRLLARVRDGFVQQGDGYDAAIVSLELAALHARLGRTVMMRRLASEALPIFRSRRVQRETLAALILLLRSPAA